MQPVLRGHVARSHVATWPRGYVATWPRSHVATFHLDLVAVQPVLAPLRSLPDSLCSVRAASCEPLTAAWNVFTINSIAQKAKWCAQTAISSKQRANCSTEKAEDHGIFFALSVVKVAP